MLHKKLIFSLIAVQSICFEASSFELRTGLSASAGRAMIQDYRSVTSGAFVSQHGKANLGFELVNRLYLNEIYFIKWGLRYNQFRTTTSGAAAPGATAGSPALSWEHGYAAIVLPVQFGRQFALPGGRRGYGYAGLSAGVLTAVYSSIHVSSRAPYNTAAEEIHAEITDYNDPLPTNFLPTFDLGAGITPFRRYPKFDIGVACNMQLNRTDPYQFRGKVTNVTQGQVHAYEAAQQLKCINYAVSFTYTFGKPVLCGGKTAMLDGKP